MKKKDDEEEKKPLPLAKFKTFKGIYIERTGDYFLCDFYEIQMLDESVVYKVSMDLPSSNRTILEMREKESGIWKYTVPHDTLPDELEQRLSECILNICLNNTR